jgi:hypothetical protein
MAQPEVLGLGQVLLLDEIIVSCKLPDFHSYRLRYLLFQP